VPDVQPIPEDAAALLQAADELFIEADEALITGDLGTYQERVEEARSLLEQAIDQLRDG
jgi:hypothetical protein